MAFLQSGSRKRGRIPPPPALPPIKTIKKVTIPTKNISKILFGQPLKRISKTVEIEGIRLEVPRTVEELALEIPNEPEYEWIDPLSSTWPRLDYNSDVVLGDLQSLSSLPNRPILTAGPLTSLRMESDVQDDEEHPIVELGNHTHEYSFHFLSRRHILDLSQEF